MATQDPLVQTCILICAVGLVTMFYFLFFYFFIVRRPWPNFVCKGRHTSSVVLVLLVLVWKAEFTELALLAGLQRTVYPYKRLHISCRSGTGQWKFAGQRPTFYHWDVNLFLSNLRDKNYKNFFQSSEAGLGTNKGTKIPFGSRDPPGAAGELTALKGELTSNHGEVGEWEGTADAIAMR